MSCFSIVVSHGLGGVREFRREQLLFEIKFGGVNLDNLVLKAQALRLAGMASVLNSPDDSSVFFSMQIRFGALLVLPASRMVFPTR